MDLFGIENITQFIACETVETGVVGIHFGAELGPGDLVPAKMFHQSAQTINHSSIFNINNTVFGY